MKSLKALGPVCSFVLAALILGAGVSHACTAKCVKVAEPFCRRCLDVGTYTGITCEDSGNCGCFLTQNTCGTLISGIQAQPDLAAVIGISEMGAVCPAQPAGDPIPAGLAR